MNKKKLILITLDKSTKEKYLEDLLYFFSDYLDIEGYSIKEGINGIIDGDLVIITSAVLTNIAKKYLSDDAKIIYMNRTFIKDNIQQLYDLPSGMKAMLVSNNNMAAIECISSLYEVGIKQLDLVPVYPGDELIPNINTAITPAQTKYIPSHVKNIINIGWRVLDLSTLMDICTILNIIDKKLEEKLEDYSKDIITISHGLNFSLNNTKIIKNQMDIVLDVIDDGVIVTDIKYEVIHCNESISRILDIDKKRLPSPVLINKIIPSEVLAKVMKEVVLENILVKSSKLNKTLIVSKRTIKVHDDIYGYVIIIRDITEFKNLENKLYKEIVKQGYTAKYNFKDIIGKSEEIIKSIKRTEKIAKIDSTVLITGESGTGKELFAQSIHNESQRKSYPFVAFNCASLSTDLLESELFGYEEGAFTGAKIGGKKGLFELANGGTIFLDEIGDVPIELQVKLLRVLEEKEVMKMGANNIIPINVRVITATNRNLKDLIKEGIFREDLYYRLNVFNIHIPPLRERKEDIPYLINDILDKIGMSNKKVDEKLMNTLLQYNWEGNVRELRNCIETMAYMGEKVLNKEDLPIDIKNYEINKFESKGEIILPELLIEENELANFILNSLRDKSMGRRLLYNQAILSGIKTTEYKVRKIMEYLYSNEYITHKAKEKGSQLTNKGKELIFKTY